jgi:type I restriction enzyme S subunit
MSWIKRSLGEYLIFKNGKTSPERDDAGSLPVFGSNGVIGFSNEANADENSLIIGRVGSYCGSVYHSESKSWVTDNAIIAQSKNASESFFWYFLLLKLNLNSMRAGSGQPLLNQAILNSIDIHIPESSEKRIKIGNILKCFDNKITLNRQINQTLEAMAQALFKSWFIDFDPVKAKMHGHKPHGMTDEIADLFPCEFEESELGLIPKGWEVIGFETIAQPKKGKNITKSTISEGCVPVVAGGLEPAYYHNTPNVFAPVITVSASGANAGYVNLYHNDIWASDCSYISKDQTRFVYSILCLLKIKQKEIYDMQQGAAQPHVYPKDLLRLKLASPKNLELWSIFEKLISPSFELIKNNIKQNDSLTNARDALLPKLLNGDLSVNEAKQ